MVPDGFLDSAASMVDLPDGAIPTHAYLIVEYENPGSDDSPETPRIVQAGDECLSLWGSLGLLQYAHQTQLLAIAKMVDVDDDPD